jgi:hypothetical protein
MRHICKWHVALVLSFKASAAMDKALAEQIIAAAAASFVEKS